MAIYIYGLICPLIDQLRYVGKTDDVDRRLAAHLYRIDHERTHKRNWLAALRKRGLEPRLVVLRTLADHEDWAAVEREEIERARSAGCPLTNLTKGGEGASLDESGRARKRDAMNKPEVRGKMASSAAARWSDPERRQLAMAALHSPASRAKASEAAKRRATPEYRAAMAAKSKAAWADRSKRDRIVAGITDETRAKLSAASKAFWEHSPSAEICRANLTPLTSEDRAAATIARSSPEYKEKMRQKLQSPEHREKLSVALKASWKRRREE